MAKHPKMIARMKQRREQGLTYRELGNENGISHTHAKRLLDAAEMKPQFAHMNPAKEI
jgi:response regulator of citrate/malate metabolism